MNRLKSLREEKGMKQSELGKLLNVQDAAISKYESGKVSLTDDTLLKLSKIFNVPVDYILGNDDYGIDYANYQMDTSEFGLAFKEKLKSILEEKDISQQEFAKITGLHPDEADAFLWGNKVPSIDELIKIAGALNVSANYLLDIPETHNENKDSFYIELTDRERKYIEVFRKLNEDNQDIIVGEMKKCLKEQRYEEAVAEAPSMRKAK